MEDKEPNIYEFNLSFTNDQVSQIIQTHIEQNLGFKIIRKPCMAFRDRYSRPESFISFAEDEGKNFIVDAIVEKTK